MLTEDFCSFEVTKLLKEKGFDAESPAMLYKKHDNADGTSEIWTACTLQMAMKWLREVHNIHIDIWSIWDTIHWIYQVFVITPQTANNSYVDKILYTSYEQAVEAAIKYCLENLI